MREGQRAPKHGHLSPHFSLTQHTHTSNRLIRFSTLTHTHTHTSIWLEGIHKVCSGNVHGYSCSCITSCIKTTRPNMSPISFYFLLEPIQSLKITAHFRSRTLKGNEPQNAS